MRTASPPSIFPSLRHPFRHRFSPVIHHAFNSTPPPTLQVFNDKAKLLQRERSASNAESSRKVDYLRDEIASRLCDRLLVLQSLCTLVSID